MAQEDAGARIAAQPDRATRLEGADLVIDNSGDDAHLGAEVDRVWSRLAELAAADGDAARRRPPAADGRRATSVTSAGRPRVGAHPTITLTAWPDSRCRRPSSRPATSPRPSPRWWTASNGATATRPCSGITGSGKTATIAWTIEAVQRPTLIIEPNKSLAAQLAAELKEFFPRNRVEYFVSYYDYYQPEAYVPSSDTYIEKDSSINDEIDRLRHATTSSLLTAARTPSWWPRSPASTAWARPTSTATGSSPCSPGEVHDQRALLRRLVDLQYSPQRPEPGPRPVPGPRRHHRDPRRLREPGGADRVLRRHGRAHPALRRAHRRDRRRARGAGHLRQHPLRRRRRAYPGGHRRHRGRAARAAGRARPGRASCSRPSACACAPSTTSRCWPRPGCAPASRTTAGTSTDGPPGEPPYTLLDFFPKDFLVVLDESHVAVPQLHGQYAGDRSRKETLVEHGFRLPSALDNRPLRFEEFVERTDGPDHLAVGHPGPVGVRAQRQRRRAGHPAHRPGRPRGRHPARPRARSTTSGCASTPPWPPASRVLVTTLTKKMAEDLTDYLAEQGVRVQYLHSDIDTIARIEILRDLRLGVFDVLVGINLLREGLDLPEVALVAILDADKEGFLRSASSLIQTMGRAARNVNGRVVLYADTITDSMRAADRGDPAPPGPPDRLQRGARHRPADRSPSRSPTSSSGSGARPSARRPTATGADSGVRARDVPAGPAAWPATHGRRPRPWWPSSVPTPTSSPASSTAWRREMNKAAEELRFEEAAMLRDEIAELRALGFRDPVDGSAVPAGDAVDPRGNGRPPDRRAAGQPRALRPVSSPRWPIVSWCAARASTTSRTSPSTCPGTG